MKHLSKILESLLIKIKPSTIKEKPMLLAFHNDAAIKNKYLARVKAHAEADEIIKGIYWQQGKGCAVGCTIHGNDHGKYETELGIPRIIARLEDGIFEGLPNGEAKAFPARFLNAVNVGADLSQVGDKFLHWLLLNPEDGVIKFAKTDSTRASIQKIGDMYARKIAGEIISKKDWRAAADAYDAAAAYAYAAAADDADAAYAAAYAAAAAAYAYAYAYAAAAAAADAAADAYDAADDARQKLRIKQANKLIELIEAAPIPAKIAA